MGKKNKYAALVKAKSDYITRVLRHENLYTPNLAEQVRLAARLLARVRLLEDEFEKDDYAPLIKTLSREGADRFSVNPLERTYKDYIVAAQDALKALGMNTDSKERKTDGDDSFADFMNSLGE